MAFQDTPNKIAIRTQWDLPILQRKYNLLGYPLSYFGLPGPEIRDLIDWRQVLGERTGVEEIGRNTKQKMQADEAASRLNLNVMINGMSSGFQLLRGNIEDVILEGTDAFGNHPVKSDKKRAHEAHFNYDIVNLDFDGGLGYIRSGSVPRVDAIKKLFERQSGHSFVLFLTINFRQTIGNEFDSYLAGLRQRDRGTGWQNLIDWYLERGHGELEHKLKATVPSFIQSVSELRMYHCVCHPPIAYEGHAHARMIHFSFELETQPGSLRAFSSQDDRDLVELPLLRSENGQIQFAEMQHPTFDRNGCDAHLAFLPNETKEAIMYSLPQNSHIKTGD